MIFDDGFKDFYTNAFPILKKYNFKATIYPVTDTLLGENIEWDIYSKTEHLSANNIKEISEYGIEIGSHTATHPDLTKLSFNKINKELSDSKKCIEDIIKKPINSISFPFGSWNLDIWNAAKKSGYKNAAAYRNHSKAKFPIVPTIGAYSFDTLDTLLQKSGLTKLGILTSIKSSLIPHFAKGSALWNYRKDYDNN